MNNRWILTVIFGLLGSGCVAGSDSGSKEDNAGQRDDAVSSSLPDLETSGGWVTCSTSGSNCGGESGTGTPVQSTFTTGTFNGRSSVANIWVGGGVSYGTACWYKKLPAPSYQVAAFEMTTDFYIPSGTDYEAIEWDAQQVRSHTIWNFGWQAGNALKKWRIFNYAAGH